MTPAFPRGRASAILSERSKPTVVSLIAISLSKKSPSRALLSKWRRNWVIKCRKRAWGDAVKDCGSVRFCSKATLRIPTWFAWAELISYRCEQIAERCAIRNVTLLVRILDEFFQHHLILRRQPVAPRVLAKDFFLFF